MPTHKGRALTERVLAYLAKNVQRASTNGSHSEWHAAKTAWWTQYLAFYDSPPDPYAGAIAAVGPPPALSVPAAIPTSNTAPQQPHIVDGRNGRQWVQSVLHYLEWRSGQKWRPVSDRFSTHAEQYMHAMRAVTQAFYCADPSPEPPPIAQHPTRPAMFRQNQNPNFARA